MDRILVPRTLLSAEKESAGGSVGNVDVVILTA